MQPLKVWPFPQAGHGPYCSCFSLSLFCAFVTTEFLDDNLHFKRPVVELLYVYSNKLTKLKYGLIMRDSRGKQYQKDITVVLAVGDVGDDDIGLGGGDLGVQLV